jgi:hypothetical protein|nr:hypothetical protein [Neorhizobium tomejilense]
MKIGVFAVALFIPTAASAVDLSISRVSSIAPVPTGTVTRTEMAPPEGMLAAPARQRPVYEVTDFKQAGSGATVSLRNVPRPEFNPLKVSYCASETF